MNLDDTISVCISDVRQLLADYEFACILGTRQMIGVGTGAAWRDGWGPLWSSAVLFVRKGPCRQFSTTDDHKGPHHPSSSAPVPTVRKCHPTILDRLPSLFGYVILTLHLYLSHASLAMCVMSSIPYRYKGRVEDEARRACTQDD